MSSEKVKPTVQYYRGTLSIRPRFHSTDYREVATLWAVDHPKLGNCLVYTSTIESGPYNGVIETRNTIYVPSDEPLPDQHKAFSKVLNNAQRCNACGQVSNLYGFEVTDVHRRDIPCTGVTKHGVKVF